MPGNHMRKKLAIVSSYNEACGNASYTHVLKNEFEKYYDVDVLPLQIDLLESNKRKIMKIANKHIDDMANKLKDYDYVNIQFEAGLYGSTRSNIVKRVKKLIRANDNLIFTMHRIDVGESIFDRNTIKKLLSGNIFKNLLVFKRSIYMPKIYKWIIQYIKKRSNSNNNLNIIVHTKRDKKVVEQLFDFHNVYDFPLTFLSEEERKRQRSQEERSIFIRKYGLQKDDIVIGLFGFINEYKGHETAIKALKLLPPNYKIMIFGSQHPMTITSFTPIDSYLDELLKLIEENSNGENRSFDKRVFFAGNLNDDDFIDALYCCDYAILPYLEVNQSGSGIASLVLESKIKALYSNNKAFHELTKYFPDSFERFDIGNYHELAYKLLNYNHDFSASIDHALIKYNLENNILLHKSIFEGTIKNAKTK